MNFYWLKKYQQQFAQLENQKTLPHAMLISGVKGSGKGELAEWLSQFLLCDGKKLGAEQPCQQCKACHLHSLGTHPDLHKVELLGSTVSVDQVRQVSKFLEQKAQLGQAQVIIIECAEKLTESAANALLKTLEEPTAHSYIILQTLDVQRLLPTIISRCQTFAIRPPTGAELSSKLQLSKQDPYCNLSHLPELSEPQLQSQFHTLSEQFLAFLSTGIGRMQLVESCLSQEHSTRWMEKIMVDRIRQEAGWQVNKLPLDARETAHLSLTNSDPLWQCYLILKLFNQKSLTMAQFNETVGLEKLFADMAQVISQQEQVWNHST